jgi:hypothetical protein
MWESRRCAGMRPSALPVAGALLAVVLCNCVHAEVRVEGLAGDVHVEATDATVAEILAALGERFALHFRGTTGSRGLTGTFEGPLRRVVARALDGYNYVIREQGDGLEVIVLSTTSPNAVTAPPFAPPTVPSRRQRED